VKIAKFQFHLPPTIRYRVNRIIAQIYRALYNPHGFNEIPSGNCPVQCEGWIPNGRWYYFRSRWITATFEVATCEEAWMRNDVIFKWSHTFSEDNRGVIGGWISPLRACILMDAGAKEYRKKLATGANYNLQ
jgi:hypothetical protein